MRDKDDEDDDHNHDHIDDDDSDDSDDNGDDYRICTTSRTQNTQPQRYQGKICAGDLILRILMNNDKWWLRQIKKNDDNDK